MSEDLTNPWCLISREEKFNCNYYIAYRDMVTHGLSTPKPYTYVKMKKYGIAIIPINDDGSTVLVGQYRYVLNRYTWEAVRGGGQIDSLPVESAQVELSEETGIRADYWLHLFTSSASPGLTDELAPGFVAWGLHAGESHPEPVERLSVRRVLFADAVSMALSGEITDLASIALILAIDARRARGDLPADLLKILNS